MEANKPNKNKIEFLKKIKKLSEKGIGGEASNAADILTTLLEKYNLKEEDLEEDELQWFSVNISLGKDKVYLKLLYDVGRHIGPDVRVYGCRSDSYEQNNNCNTIVNSTYSNFILLMQMYEHYLKLYKSEIKLFYKSFILANNLFPKETSSNVETVEKDPTKEEVEELTRIIKMSSGIKKDQFNNHSQLKQIKS